MTPLEQLETAETKHPFPCFVDWYRLKFQKREFTMVAVTLVFIGIALTILNAPVRYIAFVSCWFILILFCLGVMFLINALLMFCTNMKRAKFMKMKYREYLNYINL